MASARYSGQHCASYHPSDFPGYRTRKGPGGGGLDLCDADGVLSAWASGAAATQAFVEKDNSATAVYKGLALVTTPVVQLYAANFKAGRIDVFDAQFNTVTPASGSFTDPAIPAGFAPFNIQNLGGKLYVAYAKQDVYQQLDVSAPGNGYVDVFDATGKLLQSLVVGGAGSLLNSPWGLAIAPATFGKFANDLLWEFRRWPDQCLRSPLRAHGGDLAGRQRQQYLHPRIVGAHLWQWRQRRRQEYLYFTAGPGGQQHGLLAAFRRIPTRPPLTTPHRLAAGLPPIPTSPSMATIWRLPSVIGRRRISAPTARPCDFARWRQRHGERRTGVHLLHQPGPD